jgi:uncharacterized repeat protein (TIGR03943 family)
MSSGWIRKFIVFFIILLMISIFCFIGYRFYESTLRVTVNDDNTINNTSDYIEINSANYADILKDSHENIDKYIGKKIKFTGFVYRLYDFSENQFVLAREMIISSDNQAVVVGFLCRSGNAIQFNNKAWVEVEGTITRGNYHGDLPVIEVDNIEETNVPEVEYVYPPDGDFISTEI